MKTRSALLAAALAVAALPACKGTESAVGFSGLCAFNETCTFAASCDQQLMNTPWVNPEEAGDFVVFGEFRNDAESTADPGAYRIDTSDAFIQRYEVEVEGVVQLRRDVGPYLVPSGGTAVWPIWLLTSGAMANVANFDAAYPGRQLTATVKVSGEHRDGSGFEFEIEIPFLACNTCTEGCADVCPGPGQIGACAAAPAP